MTFPYFFKMLHHLLMTFLNELTSLTQDRLWRWQSKLLKRLDTVIRLTFPPAVTKPAFVFTQELLGEQTAIPRALWSSRDVVDLSQPGRSLAVNITSKTKSKQDLAWNKGIFAANGQSGWPRVITSRDDHTVTITSIGLNLFFNDCSFLYYEIYYLNFSTVYQACFKFRGKYLKAFINTWI